MKIIISPSKTQSFANITNGTEISLRKETFNLYSIIKGFSKDKIGKLFKIKGKLLDDTYNNYQLDFSEKPIGYAINSYNGVVFEQIQLNDYDESQLQYMYDKLRILSAMYGVLSPKEVIFPYRLDMTVKIPKINLYDFWQETIEEYFSNELLVINLASNEFSKMLKNYHERIINIEFYEESKDKGLKVVSYNTKKCRGQMLNFLIKNKVEDISKIKEFVFEGYIYSENLSNEDKFIFVRKIDC